MSLCRKPACRIAAPTNVLFKMSGQGLHFDRRISPPDVSKLECDIQRALFQVTANEKRLAIAMWVAKEVIPHEKRARSILARSRVSPENIDELIQEAYCRLSMLDSVDHIDSPAAYFLSVTRNLLVRRLRRQQIVSLEAVAEIEAFRDEMPSPEDIASHRSDFARMNSILDSLPERCGRIVRLRKIDGWSQKQIAAHFGITEKAVEKQVWLGVKAIRAGLTKPADLAPDTSRTVSRWKFPK